MSKPNFELIAGHPALDLVNTLDWRFREIGPEEFLTSYDDLLRFVEQSGLLAAKQTRQLQRATSDATANQVLRECIELRESLAQVLYAAIDERTPDSTPIKALDRYFKSAHSHQKLRWKKTSLAWKWPDSETEPELPLWLLSSSAAELLLSNDSQRIRACNNPECRWLFLDTSKNHTRRWCDMKICGNRIKARRFKALHKA